MINDADIILIRSSAPPITSYFICRSLVTRQNSRRREWRVGSLYGSSFGRVISVQETDDRLKIGVQRQAALSPNDNGGFIKQARPAYTSSASYGCFFPSAASVGFILEATAAEQTASLIRSASRCHGTAQQQQFRSLGHVGNKNRRRSCRRLAGLRGV